MGRERLKFLPQASHGSPQVYVKIIHLMIINKLNHLLVTNLINLMVVKKVTAVIMVAKMVPRGAVMFITKNIPEMNQITSQNLLFQGGSINGIPQQVSVGEKVMRSLTSQNE